MEELPNEYDVIVVGTGITGSIVAAALSRIGKGVLHLDENDYYGEEWASFNLENIEPWIANQKSFPTLVDYSPFFHSQEKLIMTDRHQRCSNKVQKWSCPEKLENKSEKSEEAKESFIHWTQEKIKSEHRKFNLDLSPKMLYSKGPLVELLISSNIARYAEFKSVTRVLTWREKHLEIVPCSRADVFATRYVSVVQKRMLVKILSLFAEYQSHMEEFQGFENKTLFDYLKYKKLDDQLIHYIVYAIAMAEDCTPCLTGVAACQRFLQSLGRYGNTPFICALYGSGELPQCFCRLCAVFGGVYHLKRSVDGFILNKEGDLTAIVSGGQRLSAKQFVVTSCLCPSQFLKPVTGPRLTRRILITDRSLVTSDKEAITLLQFPPQSTAESPVTVMEMGGCCHVCPPGLFVVHMTAELHDDKKDPIERVVAALFGCAEDNEKPTVLWSLAWQMDAGCAEMADGGPNNLKVFSGPDAGIDYDVSVTQAKDIFQNLCPGEEFLPRAPDSDEIIVEEPKEFEKPFQYAPGQGPNQTHHSDPNTEKHDSTTCERSVEPNEAANNA